MGWGAPLGFSSGKTPFEKTVSAHYGEPGWYCRFRHIPTPDHPLRARLMHPNGWATFDSPEDAVLYLDHPGRRRSWRGGTSIGWITEPTPAMSPNPEKVRPMDADELPFRCSRCGSFVSQQRLYEADDYGPMPCQRCKRQGVDHGYNQDS